VIYYKEEKEKIESLYKKIGHKLQQRVGNKEREGGL
jgi:hypothetical protein